jgi:hypothetical protein
MFPSPSIKILAAVKNNHTSEALQQQRKLSKAINAITRNGKYLGGLNITVIQQNSSNVYLI